MQVRQYCSSIGKPLVPMAPATALRFLVWLRARGRVHGAALRKFTGAITKLHEWMSLKSPMDDPVVRAAVRGFQRVTRDLGTKLNRIPLLIRDAQLIVRAGLGAAQLGRWSVVEACAAVIWQLVFFARASTLLAQRLDDIELTSTRLDVCLSYEKGDAMPGRRVSFACARVPKWLRNEPHPFFLLQQWVQWRKMGKGAFLLSGERKVLHSEASRLWEIALTEAAVKPPLGGRYLPHSARSGGASAAAAAGVADSVLQVRGGWRSAATLRSYVHEVARHPADVLYFGELAPTVVPFR